MKYYKGNVVQRNISEKLPYQDENGKKRNFYFDFIVNGTKCEVKGRVSKTDERKRDAYPEIEWYYQPQIDGMAHELTQIYGNKWRESFVQTN